jgi:hypothetical protein
MQWPPAMGHGSGEVEQRSPEAIGCEQFMAGAMQG